MVVYMNGAFLREEEALVPASDRGVLMGLGAFETMRAYSGRIFRLKAHMERLAEALGWLQISVPEGVDALGRAAEDLLKRMALSEARVRVTVTAGPAEASRAQPTPRPTTIVTAHPELGLSSRDYEDGVAAVLYPCEHGLGMGAGRKVLSYLGYVMARRAAERQGAREALLVRPDGLVVEGAFSNLFLVADGQIWTPPLALGALPGVTRQVVLALLGSSGHSIGERALTVADLRGADELFLTSSISEVLPVTRLGDRSVGNGFPGEVSRMVLGRYRERVAGEISGH